jgi:hypothetical protein
VDILLKLTSFYMETQFSDELIKGLQDCFREEHGVDLSPETANEYLNSYVDLFLAFAMPNKNDLDKNLGELV